MRELCVLMYKIVIFANMKRLPQILLFLMLVAVASCSRTDDSRLVEAERLLATHPDSALTLLRRVDPSSLNRHNTALYALLLTEAQYKNDITATSDSLINIAADYFTSGRRQVECLIFKGAVLQELGESQEAIDCLKEAERKTEPSDYETLGYINMRLGNVYMDSYIENGEDIAKYKKALQFYRRSGNEKYQLSCLGVIGALYRAENMDSAYLYIKAAIQLAEKIGNRERVAYHRELLVRAYLVDSLTQKAKEEAFRIMKDYPEYCDNDLFLDVSRIYALYGETDSARAYLNKVPDQGLSEPEQVVLLDVMYNIALAEGNYKSALDVVRRKNKIAYEIYGRGQQQQLYLTEQKYNKAQSELARMRMMWIVCVLSCCVLLLIIILYFVVRKSKENRLKKERMIIGLKEEFCKNEKQYLSQRNALIEKIEEMKRQALKQKEKAINLEDIKSALDKPLDVIKSLIVKSQIDSKPELLFREFRERVVVARLQTGVWSEMRYYVDKLNYGFLTDLEQEFPSLTNADLNFMTLLVCKFSMLEIMICMGYTNERSAFNKRIEISKKIGAGKVPLAEFLAEKIQSLKAKNDIN